MYANTVAVTCCRRHNSSMIKCTQVIAFKLRNDYIECEHNFANKGISYCEIHVHVILNVIMISAITNHNNPTYMYFQYQK